MDDTHDNVYDIVSKAKALHPSKSDSKEIDSYLHCKFCYGEIPMGTSPAEYQRIEVGLINEGTSLRINCLKHGYMNDFELKEARDMTCDCDTHRKGGDHVT